MIHIQKWTGGPSFRITDMTNAGKRGKTCRTFSWQGCRYNGAVTMETQKYADADSASLQTEVLIDGFKPEMDFDEAVKAIQATMEKYPAEAFISTHTGEIKGIEAPRQKLTAGIEGVWSGSADENGISLADLTDRNNEPREITHDQSHAKAYDLARRVWLRVMQARTMHEAAEILQGAGCKLHYYCAMD
jgi:hypothetical protein